MLKAVFPGRIFQSAKIKSMEFFKERLNQNVSPLIINNIITFLSIRYQLDFQLEAIHAQVQVTYLQRSAFKHRCILDIHMLDAYIILKPACDKSLCC